MVAVPLGKNSQWQKASTVKAGQYFKYERRWHLAITDAVPAAGDLAKLYVYAIQAMNVDGADTWVGIFPDGRDGNPLVEVAHSGKRPGPFTPATLRRKAKAHGEEAARQLRASELKLALARRLENGWFGA